MCCRGSEDNAEDLASGSTTAALISNASANRSSPPPLGRRSNFDLEEQPAPCRPGGARRLPQPAPPAVRRTSPADSLNGQRVVQVSLASGRLHALGAVQWVSVFAGRRIRSRRVVDGGRVDGGTPGVDQKRTTRSSLQRGAQMNVTLNLNRGTRTPPATGSQTPRRVRRRGHCPTARTASPRRGSPCGSRSCASILDGRRGCP